MFALHSIAQKESVTLILKKVIRNGKTINILAKGDDPRYTRDKVLDYTITRLKEKGIMPKKSRSKKVDRFLKTRKRSTRLLAAIAMQKEREKTAFRLEKAKNKRMAKARIVLADELDALKKHIARIEQNNSGLMKEVRARAMWINKVGDEINPADMDEEYLRNSISLAARSLPYKLATKLYLEDLIPLINGFGALLMQAKARKIKV